MASLVKILLPIALVVSGCGVDTLRHVGLKAAAEEDEGQIVPFDQAFVVGCGPTQHAPDNLGAAGFETFGCAIFSRDERRKVESALRIFQVNVFLPSGEFEARPATVELDQTSPWHAYFNLPVGVFATVQHIEVKAFYGDDETSLNNGGLVVYDPEGLSDRDEAENTFVVRKDTDPVIDFKKVDGHILFVTSVDLIPGQDFNSVEGADLRCSIEAQKVVPLAIYRFAALLTDETHDAKTRVEIKGPIRDVNEEILIDDGATLFTGNGFGGQLKVVNGDLATNALRVWTGSADRNCDAWGSKDPAKSAIVGDPSAELWLNTGESTCSKGYRIYCLSR